MKAKYCYRCGGRGCEACDFLGVKPMQEKSPEFIGFIKKRKGKLDGNFVVAVGVMLFVFLLFVFLGLFESGCTSQHSNPAASAPTATATPWTGTIEYAVDCQSLATAPVYISYLDATGTMQSLTFTPSPFLYSWLLITNQVTVPFTAVLQVNCGMYGCAGNGVTFEIDANANHGGAGTFLISQNQGTYHVTGYQAVQ